jgi:hypothetical protein
MTKRQPLTKHQISRPTIYGMRNGRKGEILSRMNDYRANGDSYRSFAVLLLCFWSRKTAVKTEERDTPYLRVGIGRGHPTYQRTYSRTHLRSMEPIRGVSTTLGRNGIVKKNLLIRLNNIARVLANLRKI